MHFDPLNLFTVNRYYIKPTRRFSIAISQQKELCSLADTLLFCDNLLLQMHIRFLYCFDTSLLQIPDTAPPGQSGRFLPFCSGNFVPVSGIPVFSRSRRLSPPALVLFFFLFKYSFLLFCRQLNYVICFVFRHFHPKSVASSIPDYRKFLINVALWIGDGPYCRIASI